LAIISEERNGYTDEWVMKHQMQRLTTWLKDQNIATGETTNDITISRLLAGPSRQVAYWKAYEINGYTYYIHAKDSTYVNQNSGVRIEALDGMGRKIQFFDIIEDIWKLDYGRDIQVAMF
jgi:hypothetical protein